MRQARPPRQTDESVRAALGTVGDEESLKVRWVPEGRSLCGESAGERRERDKRRGRAVFRAQRGGRAERDEDWVAGKTSWRERKVQ